MKAEVRCEKHNRTIRVVPPKWVPFVVNWESVREQLTGCVCADPTPAEFDAVWQEILGHLHALQDEPSSREISSRLRMVRGVPLSVWLDGDVFARILRGATISQLLDPDDPRRPRPEER